MKIYTKTGDGGTTGLFGGARVDKDDPRVEAYGSLDETNSALGAAAALPLPEDVLHVLRAIQVDLFSIGAELACVAEKREKLRSDLVSEAHILGLERAIDDAEATLPPLRAFILPGGSPGAAALHQARTTCRRAERRLITLSRAYPVRAELMVYVNRLSDLLFVLARRANAAQNVEDVLWSGERRR